MPQSTTQLTEPKPHADQPRWVVLIAIAVVCLAAGFGVSHCSLSRDRVQESASSPGEEPQRAAEPAPAAQDASVDAAADAEPVTTPRRRGLAPGRVAYLRCPGAEVQAAAFPCPRDRALEDAVWAVLEELPRCPLPAPGIGEADLRLLLVPGQATELRLRERGEDEPAGLDSAALLTCLRPRLSPVQTELSVEQLVVSFRFSLVGQD